MKMIRRHSLALALVLSLAGTAAAQHPMPAAPAEGAAQTPKNPYGAYAFLVGEWDVAPEDGGDRMGVARFKWGPNRSYIWFSMSLTRRGKEEPHFEGLLVWNGVKKNLDMLLVVDLANGLVQEQGSMSVADDGTVVRDITMVASEGVGGAGKPAASRTFRQTFRAAAADRVLTNAMRKTDAGWVPTFPGSDRLVMLRRV
jgi:hypothetical protein